MAHTVWKGTVIGVLVLTGGIDFVEFFNYGIQLFLGVVFLFFNPISRLNANYRKLEIILGLFMVIIVFVRVILRFTI